MTIDTHANTVHPFPYPSASNIAGANRGKPKPAKDRRHDTAASAVRKEGGIREGISKAKT